MAHIVVLFGSPRRHGNTALLTEAFLSGLAPRHTADVIRAAEVNVHPCTGCNACFHAEGNACVQRDDMDGLYARLAAADVLVIATPLYFYGVSAQLKLLTDRLHNPIRNTFRVRTLVLLAAAGNDDPDVFRPLIGQYEAVLRYFHLKDGGILTVPGVRRAGEIAGHPALEQARALGASI